MRRIKLWIAIAACTSAGVALGQDANYGVTSNEGDLFRAGEMSLDLFGTASLGQEVVNNISANRIHDNGRLGAGAGLNYFFTSMVGVGADAYSEDTQHDVVDKASGNVIVRFPFEPAHLAPYVFGGGGRQFDPRDEWLGQAGGGLDVRFTHNIGLVSDARYMFIHNTDDSWLFRLGLRVVF